MALGLGKHDLVHVVAAEGGNIDAHHGGEVGGCAGEDCEIGHFGQRNLLM